MTYDEANEHTAQTYSAYRETKLNPNTTIDQREKMPSPTLSLAVIRHIIELRYGKEMNFRAKKLRTLK